MRKRYFSKLNLSFLFILGLSSSAYSEPLPGQIIVDPDNPSWLVYNKDEDEDGQLDTFFMAGPGDPEDFLYRGQRLADGTRSGDQNVLLEKLKGSSANSIYFQAVRSHGGDGSADHNPFVDSDPSKGVDFTILNQWETWFAEMDSQGIVIYLFLYDDSIRVGANLGWPLDSNGNLHPGERGFIEAIVNRFEHHKHLIWVVMEEVQEMGSDYIQHTKKIAEHISSIDDHQHVIAVHKLSGLDFSDFADDPNIDQFAIQYNGQDAGGLHSGMLEAWTKASGRYNLNMSEASDHYSNNRALVRKKNWASAMGGAYVMILGMTIADTPVDYLNDVGRLVSFMERTKLNTMAPHDELAFDGTDYVLAEAGLRYIAYASNLTESIGIKNMTAGHYDFLWFDAVSGQTFEQEHVWVETGDQAWIKPSSLGSEIALYLNNSDSDTSDKTPPTAPTNLRNIEHR